MSQDATSFQPHDAGQKGTQEASAHAQSPDGRTPFVVRAHDSSSTGRAPHAPDVLEAPDEADTSGPPQLDRRQLVVALAGVMLAILLAALDQTIVGTACRASSPS